MQIKEIYLSLIIRYLKKEISEDEQKELFHWVYMNSENERFFYSIKDIWETARYDNVVKGANTDQEWEKLALKAIKDETSALKEKSTVYKTLWRTVQIAAIVIIVFGIGFFVQKYLPEETSYASVNVPYGAKSQLQLPDGSMVWVNSGSTVKYPSNFEGKEINVFLEGEAFFDIVKNPKRVLNVKTSTINIQVHGTTFNVKSYNDEDIVETTLIEGSISLTGQVGGHTIKEPIFLKPNEQATLTKSKNKVEVEQSFKNEELKESNKQLPTEEIVPVKPSLQIKERIEPEQFVMWKNNVLVFKNERFEELSVKLERWYDVQIVIEDNELKSSRYTGTFENETIEQAMNALSLSLPFEYTIEKNRITVHKKYTYNN